MSLAVDIRFNRANKTYSEGEEVSGSIILTNKTETRHEGISLEMEGAVQMQLSGKNVGILDSFSSSAKPIILTSHTQDLAKAGRILPGKTEVAFQIPLSPKLNNRPLYETYHGVCIAIQYTVKCEVKRSFPSKSINKMSEFLVEYKKGENHEKALAKPIAFTITPESVVNKEKSKSLPQFSITGRLDSSSCVIGTPLSGEVTLHKSDVPLKSIDLQLIRVETCGASETLSREATEIQTLQIADGNIPKNVAIPIYMVFPRLFVCPSIATPNFKLDFELSLVFSFTDNHSINENIPITLHRF